MTGSPLPRASTPAWKMSLAVLAGSAISYVRCCEKNLFISNMVALSLPKIFLSASSATISRLFAGFCRLFALMYSQTLLTTSPRASGCDPTMTAKSSDGCRGFCRAFGALPALGGETFFPFTAPSTVFSGRVSCSCRSLFLPRS